MWTHSLKMPNFRARWGIFPAWTSSWVSPRRIWPSSDHHPWQLYAENSTIDSEQFWMSYLRNKLSNLRIHKNVYNSSTETDRRKNSNRLLEQNWCRGIDRQRRLQTSYRLQDRAFVIKSHWERLITLQSIETQKKHVFRRHPRESLVTSDFVAFVT